MELHNVMAAINEIYSWNMLKNLETLNEDRMGNHGLNYTKYDI